MLVLAWTLLVPVAGDAMALPLSPECRVPDSVLSLAGELERVERLVDDSSPVTVLSVGPSSAPVPEDETAATERMPLEVELERRFPDVDFRVEEMETQGEAAPRVLEQLERTVIDESPDLVIWQVGTTDALQDVDPGRFASAVDQGVEWMTDRGIDVILMDPQYFPRVDHEPAYRTYVDAIGRVASEEGVPVLHRYTAMQHWARSSKQASPSLRSLLQLARKEDLCLAEVLAEGIVRRVTGD
jgi:acyl-CoA thioesterase-1